MELNNIKKIIENYYISNGYEKFDITNINQISTTNKLYMYKFVKANESTALNVPYKFIKINDYGDLISMNVNDKKIIMSELGKYCAQLEKLNTNYENDLLISNRNITKYKNKWKEQRKKNYQDKKIVKKIKTLFESNIADDLAEFKEIVFKYIFKDKNYPYDNLPY